MRGLHGIAFVGHHLSELKRKSLLFDTFHVWSPEKKTVGEPDLDFLRANGLIRDVWFDLGSLAGSSIAHNATMEMFFVPQLVGDPNTSFSSQYWPPVPPKLINGEVADCITRSIARSLMSNETVDVVPIYEQPMSPVLTAYYALGSASQSMPIVDTANVALKMLPVPDDTCGWQDILDFKSEMRDKLWHFRRFLRDLATKKQTEAEVRDDIEWSLNEYTTAMKLHNLKAANSFVDVYVIPAIEVLEDLAKFNWSKIAKNTLSVRKGQVQLMEAEMAAPGREVAYVYDAKKRFASQ